MTTIHIDSRKPVAYDSPDHIQPHGTAVNNTVQPRFNRKLFRYLPAPRSPARHWCAGEGWSVDPRRRGFAVGIEGSDTRKKIKTSSGRRSRSPVTGRRDRALLPIPGGVTGQEPLLFNISSAPGEFFEHIADVRHPRSPRHRPTSRPQGSSWPRSPTYPNVGQGVVFTNHHQKQWGLRKRFYQLDLEHQESLERYFHFDMVNANRMAVVHARAHTAGPDASSPSMTARLDRGSTLHQPGDAAMDVSAVAGDTRLADETSDRAHLPAARPFE